MTPWTRGSLMEKLAPVGGANGGFEVHPTMSLHIEIHSSIIKK